MQYKQGLIFSESLIGFDKTTIDTYLEAKIYQHKLTVYQDIQRLDSDDNVIVKLGIITALDNSIEEIYFCPKTVVSENPIDYDIIFQFLKRNDDNKTDRYYFWGRLGGDFELRLSPISLDTYAKARAMIIEMINPNNEYRLERIINLLQASENPKVTDFANAWTDLISSGRLLRNK